MRRPHIITAAITAVVAAALAVLLLPRFGDTEGWLVPISPSLPKPTGEYAVGVRDTIFYPAAGELESYAHNQYLPEELAADWGAEESHRLGLRTDAVNWQFRTAAHLYAPVRAGRYPVAIYSPPRATYTHLAEELASHGYIVIGVTDAQSATNALTHLDEDLARAADQTHVGTFGDLERPGKPSLPLDATATDAAYYLPRLAAAWRDNAAQLPTPPQVPAALARHLNAPDTSAATRKRVLTFFNERVRR